MCGMPIVNRGQIVLAGNISSHCTSLVPLGHNRPLEYISQPRGAYVSATGSDNSMIRPV